MFDSALGPADARPSGEVMDFTIWCLVFLSWCFEPSAIWAARLPSACEAANHIVAPYKYDEPRHVDGEITSILAAIYPHCREEFVRQGHEEFGANWRPGMKLRDSKKFRINPVNQNVYYCGPIPWDELAVLAEISGQTPNEINLWRREQAIDSLYASQRSCEGCGDYHWMLLNPSAYDDLVKAGESADGLKLAATDIGLEHINFFVGGVDSCAASEDGPSNSSYFNDSDLQQGVIWLKKAGWTNVKIKKEVKNIIPELEDHNPDRVKEAVQAVNDELAKL